MTIVTISNHRTSRARLPLALALLSCTMLLLLATACGGGSSKTSSTTPPTASTAVQFNMGDAPADWLLSFTMQLSSFSLTDASGAIHNVSIDSVPVEMMQRLGTMEPVAIAGIPQRTYTSASLTIASCAFSYLDPNTKEQVQKTLNGPFEAVLPFASNVTIGSTPYLFNFDLDLQHSLTADGSGAFHFSPRFHNSFAALQTGTGAGSGSGNGMNARYGGMYQMMGIVGNAGSDSFTLLSWQSAGKYTFRVNAATRFQGKVQQMSKLAAGMGVLVTGLLQSDGSLLATRVRGTMSAGGAMGGGIITSVDQLPATRLTIVMQNGAGASINTDYLSKSLTVNLSSDTAYEIDTDRVSLVGLPFVPVFDQADIYAGQSVLPFSDADIVANTACDPACGEITASTIRLREQGFRGVADVEIAPGATGPFTLTLPADCAFTTLTGATEIVVYQQPGTNVEDQTPIPAGTTLRVHGLLFKNGSQWILVASTIASA
jgi:hypothetical protein